MYQKNLSTFPWPVSSGSKVCYQRQIMKIAFNSAEKIRINFSVTIVDETRRAPTTYQWSWWQPKNTKKAKKTFVCLITKKKATQQHSTGFFTLKRKPLIHANETRTQKSSAHRARLPLPFVFPISSSFVLSFVRISFSDFFLSLFHHRSTLTSLFLSSLKFSLFCFLNLSSPLVRLKSAMIMFSFEIFRNQTFRSSTKSEVEGVNFRDKRWGNVMKLSSLFIIKTRVLTRMWLAITSERISRKISSTLTFSLCSCRHRISFKFFHTRKVSELKMNECWSRQRP